MALRWSWAFGNESGPTLVSMAGFTFGNSGAVTATSAASEVYSYTGSPTRWGLKFTTNGNSLTPPTAPFTNMNRGLVVGVFKVPSPSPPFIASDLLQVTYALGTVISARMVPATGALALYVDSVFKINTVPYDWSDWHSIALEFDVNVGNVAVGLATNFAGRIYVDGVDATGSFTDAATAQLGVIFRSALPQSGSCIGQFVVWDALADAATARLQMYVTRAEPTADRAGATVGTWTPSTGGTQFGVLASPLSTATFTTEAAPVAGERVAVDTSTITTALGGAPPTVYGLTTHTYSAGQAVSARARISDNGGTNWANGSNVLIDAVNTTYAWVTAPTKPSTGTAWTGADTATMAYEVV